MIVLDESFLQDVGLGSLTGEEKQSFLDYVREELELRTGLELSEKLTEEELDDFDKLGAKTDDQEAVKAWMEQHCPDYEKVTQRIFDELKREVLESAGRLLVETPPVPAV
jgi:hypothetical protein